MEANRYQTLAERTMIDAPDHEYGGDELMLVWNAIGLAGEAGEVADTVKKTVFHRHPLNRDGLIEELGDVLWYVAALCVRLQTTMDDVMHVNIEKLQARYPDGWDSGRSISRVG